MFSAPLTISLWQHIEELDRSLFLILNTRLANPVFDAVLPYFRDSVFWAPLYIFIMAFVVLNFGKKGLWWALCFIATVAIADLIGTYGFKETIRRIRPCNEPLVAEQTRMILKKCSGGYSFLSNHAANHFGLATFITITYKPILKGWIYFAYLWALLISFAQVYVGVHYPLDILGGAALGTLAGYLMASVYHHNFGKLNAFT